MFDYVYRMNSNLLEEAMFGVIKLNFVIMYATLLWTTLHNVATICKPLVDYPF